MRVDVAELEQIRDGLAGTGRRYSEPDLEGAILDCDHALYEGGLPAAKYQESDRRRVGGRLSLTAAVGAGAER